jgi:tellurite resistance protein TerC
MARGLFGQGYQAVRRVVVAVVGGTVVLVGVALLVLPGPAFVVIPAGLAILAMEFAWARRWLNKARAQAAALVQRAQGSNPASPER